MSSSSFFKARQFGNESVLKRSFLADSTMDSISLHQPASSGHLSSELTKTDKYCVSRLPALPPVLSHDRMEDSSSLLNGYADGKTEFALVVSEKSIDVWPYNSSDDVPISFEFPLGESSQDALQLAILTRSSPGTSLDPGLVIINSISGHVRFYESVQHAPALGMINSKSIETTINILAGLGEYITLAENVEPAGIVVATSWKRVVLVLLRDHKGAPKLSSLELTRPSTSSRLFSGWLGLSDDELTDDIVSIKSGVISALGTTQEIIVQDAAGTFKKYLYQSSSTGTPIINHKKTLLHRLATFLESNIDGLIPGAVLNVKFLDLWPAFSSGSQSDKRDLYIALVCIQSSLRGSQEERLILLTMKINESGVMIIASHLLPEVHTTNNLSLVSKPKLFIPKPGKSAFVVIGNAVVLCDLASETAKSGDFAYYKPKWEDTIKFKPSVQVIGCGYEDKVKDDENSALLFITSDFGVVRIERFTPSDEDCESQNEDPTNPVSLLKSHIQQAVYFDGSSFVDFNVGPDFSDEVVIEAVNSVVSEIMSNSSPYLPAFLSSTRDTFALRLKLLRSLLEFVKSNFVRSWIAVYPSIVDTLEKIECALNLWNLIDMDDREANQLKKNLKAIISNKHSSSINSKSDVLRSYFSHNVSDILDILTRLIEDSLSHSQSIKTSLKILLITLHDAVYCNELAYIVPNDQIPARKLWVFDSGLIVRAEELISLAYCSSDDNLVQTSSGREEFVKFIATLYYLISSAIVFMKSTDDDQLQEYTTWFENRRKVWITSLLEYGLLREALVIAETYKDFSSISQVLEKERELSSPEYILDKIAIYMAEYGYEFACKLFEFDIELDKIQRLLSEYAQYEEFLTRFFEEFPYQTAAFSWIHYIKAKSFEEASNVLISMNANKNFDQQHNREFSFSMAKLAAIAAETEDSKMVDSYALEELVIEAENNLVGIRIQNKLFNHISLFVHNKTPMVTKQYFLDNFANTKIPRSQIESEILPFFYTFIEERQLTKGDLTILLSIVNPISQLNNVFADALTVAALISNDNEFRKAAAKVWSKLLTKTDDWSVVTATGDNTDEVNKIKIKETILYHTLKEVKFNKDIIGVLESVVNGSIPDDSSDETDRYWAEQVHNLGQRIDLKKWISIIQAET